MKNPSLLWHVFDQSQPSSPIIVKIIEPAKSELSGLSDVLIGSLGLTGVITLAALLMGVLLAGVMFWVRSRQQETEGTEGTD